MDKNAKIIFLSLFLVSCGMLFSLFTLWTQKEGLLSPEIHFFSFRTQRSTQDTIKNLFLTYPTLSSVLSSLFPSSLTLPVVVGLFITLFSLSWLFPSDPFFLGFLLTTITSPFFLASLSLTPTLVLFFTLLLGSFSHLLQYEERRSPYHLFLGGLTLGVAFLANFHLEWFALGIALLMLFFLPGNATKKVNLLVVVFFPILVFLGILVFLNWVYTGQVFAFLHPPHSFLPHLSVPSLQNIKYTLLELRQWTIFLLPLFFALLQDKRRVFLGFILFFGIMTLPFSPSLLATVSALSALFFKKTAPGKVIRYALSFSLGIAFLAGWILFFLSPLQFFAFPPYDPLWEKLAEYREAHSLLSSPGRVLVLDTDYFLISSWGKAFKSITPEDPPFRATLFDLSCDYIVTLQEESEAFPGFREIFRGEKLIVYQKGTTFPTSPPNPP